ncbi:MAG: Na+/H+ antiporter NhaA [Myxococcaceae bacterium]|nr:Na+/H+ antiporter NhaA [Myxococcaceae bacterium]
MTQHRSAAAQVRLLRPLEPARDHFRDRQSGNAVVVVGYEDFLCPYCRRLRQVYLRLREALGDRLVYAYRHFPNERAHPGAVLAAQASEAAARQGRFWEMHDRIFDHELPIGRPELFEMARDLGLDLVQFERDLGSDEVRARVQEDLEDGKRNGVTGTPTLFVDGVRYDGAWDYYSMLESLERPIAARVRRSAQVFASLPASAALVLLLAAVVALLIANSPLAPVYERWMSTELGGGLKGRGLSLTVREWFSEGLLAVFFLLVGLEIRRELTRGALSDHRAATLPIVAAFGGVVMPALLYLVLNPGPSARGWAVPTATDVAFALALLALLGDRIPIGLRVFVAALAVVDDMLSVLTIAVFYPGTLEPRFAIGVIGALLLLVALNRARVYVLWPYLATSVVLWGSLHALGVHSALTGVVLAMCVPTRPAPDVGPLLAQATTALTSLEQEEREGRRAGRTEQSIESEPVWEWAARNLSAASARLLSPAERLERAVAPWSAYFILPLFAFSATGVRFDIGLSSPHAERLWLGVVVGLVIGKPLGVLVASALSIGTGLAMAPEGVSRRDFVGGACLCGVGYTVAVLMADRAFGPEDAAVAKLAVLAGSTLAAALGMLVLRRPAVDQTPVDQPRVKAARRRGRLLRASAP